MLNNKCCNSCTAVWKVQIWKVHIVCPDVASVELSHFYFWSARKLAKRQAAKKLANRSTVSKQAFTYEVEVNSSWDSATS
jgi:hypothetical protein